MQCLVLAMHGDNDEYGSIRHPDQIVELTAGHSTREILQKCGHVPHREQADLVLDTVKQWLTPVVG